MVERPLIEQLWRFTLAVLFCLVAAICLDLLGFGDDNTFLVMLASLALMRTFEWKAK